MAGRIDPKHIRWAMLIIDPEDEQCQRVATELREVGISFETKEVGPKIYGCGVDVALSGVPDTFTQFATKLTPPILIVEHALIPTLSQFTVLEGHIAISQALDVYIPSVGAR